MFWLILCLYKIVLIIAECQDEDHCLKEIKNETAYINDTKWGDWYSVLSIVKNLLFCALLAGWAIWMLYSKIAGVKKPSNLPSTKQLREFISQELPR
ncbi:unnamed protein product [Blepharisma stoltei]|uniref:ATP synthase F0 subunit 8 n=1 Tax=Blepharisma stoltei TaxID=1481888 RepID=A0AAU9K0T5_9CILI|nr:unnamed protein product [Blepharisma stoltei]